MNEQDKKLCEELRFQTRYAVGVVPVTMEKAAQAIERLSAERDELLAALESLIAGLDATNWSSWQTTAYFDPALDTARAVIAKVKGQT